ncbi:LysM peptidoglycan-binding domain-containing protein [Lachnospiraceae bacterium DSM 108991]|uniref:LysM peptidoglycan-binding domain-containing protein n=1 Tax=Claveliimonas monacensis TaxID=2779351 RepID=A0ABR9RMB5_9FIRM|nr:LysM domain-containing protein [Claveliimonas monacensis]MBE5063675.1 LysM peptidoglycan-binding domain-containing protein [Claveliimonas monacensis]
MERKFPKNVRQVGNVSDIPKIYLEDYVDTYLDQLRSRAKEEPTGALLLGENAVVEGLECVYITGAVRIEEVSEENGEICISDPAREAALRECAEYFPGRDVVGWALAAPGRPLVLSGSMVQIHEQLGLKKNSIFIMKHPEEDEEIYFAYKFHELMQMGGYYIFYEKNPDMQNYMINTRKQIGVTPSEVVEDRAAKNFRSAVKEKLEAQEQRSNSHLVYLTSVLLVVVVLAIGISAMNNYDKMNSVQSSIETLSKSVQGSSENTVTAEEDAAADQQEEQPDGAAASDVSAGAGDVQTGESGMSIQEGESGEEYYTVQRGDTLDKISLKLYGTTDEAEAICKMNGLTDGNLIFIGQKLLLP